MGRECSAPTGNGPPGFTLKTAIPFHRRKRRVNLEKAVGTAKYANHAKTERMGEKDVFTQRENAYFDSTPFPFAYLAYFAVPTARFRFMPWRE